MTRTARFLVFVALLVWMLVPLARHLDASLATFGMHGYWRGMSDAERLRTTRLPAIHWVDEVDRRLQPGECVLVYRQAEYGVHGRHCFFSYLDEKLIPLHRATTVDQLSELLSAHRIRYIMTGGYQLPEIYNSQMGALLADPTRAVLFWDLDQTKLFRVSPAGRVTPPPDRRTLLQFDSATPLRNAAGEPKNSLQTAGAKPFVNGLTSQRSYVSPILPEAPAVHPQWCTHPIAMPRLRGFEIELRGLGYVYLVVLNGAIAFREDIVTRYGIQMIWDGVINGTRVIRGQYLVHPGHCDPFEVRFSTTGRADLDVVRGEIFEYSTIIPEPDAFARDLANVRGWEATAGGRYQGGWNWGLRADGTFFSEPHPAPLARTVVRSPVSDMAQSESPGAKALLVELQMRVSGTGTLQAAALVHPGPHSTELSRREYEFLAYLRDRDKRDWWMPESLRLLGSALARGKVAEAPPRAGIDELRLPNGLMQPVRRWILYEGSVDVNPLSMVFPLIVADGDRVQFEFAPGATLTGQPPSAVIVHELYAYVDGTGGKRAILRSPEPW